MSYKVVFSLVESGINPIKGGDGKHVIGDREISSRDTPYENYE